MTDILEQDWFYFNDYRKVAKQKSVEVERQFEEKRLQTEHGKVIPCYQGTTSDQQTYWVCSKIPRDYMDALDWTKRQVILQRQSWCNEVKVDVVPTRKIDSIFTNPNLPKGCLFE